MAPCNSWVGVKTYLDCCLTRRSNRTIPYFYWKIGLGALIFHVKWDLHSANRKQEIIRTKRKVRRRLSTVVEGRRGCIVISNKNRHKTKDCTKPGPESISQLPSMLLLVRCYGFHTHTHSLNTELQLTPFLAVVKNVYSLVSDPMGRCVPLSIFSNGQE